MRILCIELHVRSLDGTNNNTSEQTCQQLFGNNREKTSDSVLNCSVTDDVSQNVDNERLMNSPNTGLINIYLNY